MQELKYLKQKEILITDKQYKIILVKISIIMTISGIICLGGMAVMMIFENNRTLFIIGLSMFAISPCLFIFDVFFIMTKYAAKIQLYRHYKKYPQDFESEI